MTDHIQDIEVLGDLLGQSDAMANLLQARGSFEAAYAAFRAEDAEKFQSAIAQANLQLYCERICHWIRTKECVFLCLELAGPPVAATGLDPRVLAKAIARIGDDPKLAKHIADILEKRDRAGFAEVLKKLDIQPYAHLFCHWLCIIRYRLVCRWICHVGKIDRPVLAAELQNAARAIAVLFKDEKSFRAAVAASAAGDTAKLGAAITAARLGLRCHFVCEFFCSWRCVLVCLTLARAYPFKAIEGPMQVREAHDFAAALVKLAQNPTDLMRFSTAVGTGNVDAWAALIKQYKFEGFALQLCHWICGWRCVRFCKLVCVNVYYHPWFTHIGDFGIAGDISPATGRTVAPRGGHGGPDFAFYGGLSLRGFCPKKDPAHPSENMAYRFLFQPAGAAQPTPIGPGLVAEVLVGTRYCLWNGDPNTLQTIRISGVGTTSPTPPTPTADLTPPDHIIVPDLQGWVAVDQAALDDAFSGYLMGFNSLAGVVPNGPETTAVDAGTEVPVGDQKSGVNCAIIFQATRVSTIAAVNGGAAPDYTNQIGKVEINNWGEVALLNLLQFHSGGGTPCSPLSTDLDIEYSVDHELIADWGISLSTAAGVSLTNPPPPPSTARGGFGTHHEDISAWPTCSYTVTLTTRRRLTTGLSDDPNHHISRTFCIGRRVVRPS
ncbi:MAG: hypothetical protein ABI810_18285 [Sphingomonas bacterium]